MILAGGKSSRMKQDKALLPFGGESSLAKYQCKRFKAIFRECFLSAKEDKFDFEAKVILDKSEIFSPLQALKSILEELKEAVFVVGVDMPYLSKETIYKILESFDNSYDIVVAKHKNSLEPLCGVYNYKSLDIINHCLNQDIHKLNYLLKLSKTLAVEIKDSLDFTNLNYPKDYKEATSLFDTISKKI